MLLDPPKKQLDLPTKFVKLGDGKGRNDEAVRKECQKLVGLSIVIPRASKLIWVIFGRIEAGQYNCLVTPQAEGFVNGMGIHPTKLKVGLGTGHEESTELRQRIEPG